MCIEFYQKKYPELSYEEQLELLNNHKKNIKTTLQDKTKQPKCTEYWIAKGYTKEEAKEIISKSQATFTLKNCIEKYGEEEGTKIFNERQKKWQKSLRKNFEKYGDGRSNSSEFAYDMINQICERLSLNKPKKEKYIRDKNGNCYAYDFCLNKKIIEFNGDYWHANPKIYNEDFINKVKNMSALEIWEYDNNKKICAENHGYEILYIWELDYNQSREDTINKCIEFLTS